MSYCFGNEIRNVFNESDIYAILLNVMVSFPLNDIALQQVKLIFDHIIGNPFIKDDEAQQKICHDIMLEVIIKSNMIETIICQAKTTEYLGKAYFNRLGQQLFEEAEISADVQQVLQAKSEWTDFYVPQILDKER